MRGFGLMRPGDTWTVPTIANRTHPMEALSENASEYARLRYDVHLHAIRKIKHLCDRIGAELILFDIGYPRQFREATETFAASLGVRYSAAGRRIMDRALAGEPMYLVNDGHWSQEGCDAMAQDLYQDLQSDSKTPPPPRIASEPERMLR